MTVFTCVYELCKSIHECAYTWYIPLTHIQHAFTFHWSIFLLDINISTCRVSSGKTNIDIVSIFQLWFMRIFSLLLITRNLSIHCWIEDLVQQHRRWNQHYKHVIGTSVSTIIHVYGKEQRSENAPPRS